MSVSLNLFKVKAYGNSEVEQLKQELALYRQRIDAQTLASYPGGLKKRNKTPAYDDDATYRPGAFSGLTAQ